MGYFKKVKSFSDLKRQYRKLLRKWHPDNDGGEEEVMKEINAEFDTLYVIWKDTQESEKGIVIKQTAEQSRAECYKEINVQKKEVYPFWNLEDIKGMVDSFTNHKLWHWRLAFMFGLLMGRRVSDTLDMDWCDLYEKNGDRKTHLLINEGKTGKGTYVLIPDLIWSEVELYISKTGVNPAEDGYRKKIFPGTTDRKDAAYRAAFKKAAKEAGITYPVSTHSTRKTFGYYSFKLHPYDPANLDVLQRFFNHSDRSTTLAYTGLTQEKQDNYSSDWGNVMTDVLEGKNPSIENSPVITLRSEDLRDVLVLAYKMGADQKDDVLCDMNKLISIVEQKRVM